MDFLPRDPAILTSAVNMLLRDGEFDSLEQVCNAYGHDLHDILSLLHDAGYTYSTEQRQIRPEGFDQ